MRGVERCERWGGGGGMTKGDSCDTNPIHPLAHIYTHATFSNQCASFLYLLPSFAGCFLDYSCFSCYCSLETGDQLQ